MTNHEKQIRTDWRIFKNKQKKAIDRKQEEQKVKELQAIFKAAFGR